MDTSIRKHFQQNIKGRVQLTGGYSFNTWLLVLENGQKIVFRSSPDFETSGGRKIVIAETFEREKFFYDNVNREIGHICPNVYVIDDTRKYYKDSYQISEYLVGTPLNLCIDDFDVQEKNDIYYKIGEITAKINKLEIDEHHPYVSYRSSWEEFMAVRLSQRMMPLVKNNVITPSEINKITEGMRSKKAAKTLSYLHLDMRLVNMIYNDGEIFVLDAENCEFGDPLFDLAVVDVGGGFNEPFLNGYKSIFGADIDLGDLFYYYKMERQALVLDVFMNEVQDAEKAQFYLEKFYELKNRLL